MSALRKTVGWKSSGTPYFGSGAPQVVTEGKTAEPAEIPKGLCTTAEGLESKTKRITLMCGTTGSGKSMLMRSWIWANRCLYNYIFLLSPSMNDSDTDPYDYNFIGKDWRIAAPTEETLRDILEFQKEHPGAAILVIMDDIMGEGGIDMKGKLWTQIASSAVSHKNVSFLVLLQNLTTTATTFRNSAAVVYVTHAIGSFTDMLAKIVGVKTKDLEKLLKEKETFEALRFNLKDAGREHMQRFKFGKCEPFFIDCD